MDDRSGNADIYAQRINSTGNKLWSTNGIVICNANNSQSSPQIINDGSGGAIITWVDDRSGNDDIYAQRVDSEGNTLWAENGAPVCIAVDNQNSPQIINDGDGGAIITWVDDRSGNDDIYAQRINSTGNKLWSTNGIVICNAANDQVIPQLCTDGADGAIICWKDSRTGGAAVYAQAIDSKGIMQWFYNGATICNTAISSVYNLRITNDAGSGAIIIWHGTGPFDIYAQRINSTGSILWSSKGVTICDADNHQHGPQIINDGSGGAIITWVDDRSGNNDIYAQRILRRKPVIDNLDPEHTVENSVINLSLSGKYFKDDQGHVNFVKLTKNAEPDVIASNINILDESNLTCDLDLTGVALGDWYVVAYDSVGQTSTGNVVFTVVELPTPPPHKRLKALNNRINPNKGEYTIIQWFQPAPSWVKIRILNIKGEVVKTLVNDQYLHSGQRHEIIWRGLNSSGGVVGSGIYIVHLHAGTYKAWVKVAVIQ